MKNKLILFGLITMIYSCGPDYKLEVENLKNEQDSLLSIQMQKDSLMNSYINDFNEIQLSIESLAQQEKLLVEQSKSNELTLDAKTKILNNIESFRKIIDQNKNKISSLQRKIKNYSLKIDELDKMIANLNLQLLERDSSIALLSENINKLNSKIASVELELTNSKNDNEQKKQEIADKTIKLHTAYYTVGTYRELKDKKVLSKEGGILGLGSSKSFTSDLNNESFTKIDYTSTKLIDIISKKIEIISIHPSDSYKIINNGKQIMAIEILDPERFWQASKYLVVVKS
jgi:chromosome segregation ATPase